MISIELYNIILELSSSFLGLSSLLLTKKNSASNSGPSSWLDGTTGNLFTVVCRPSIMMKLAHRATVDIMAEETDKKQRVKEQE